MPVWDSAALSHADSLVKPEPWVVHSIAVKLEDRASAQPSVVSCDIVRNMSLPPRNGKRATNKQALSIAPLGSLFIPSDVVPKGCASFDDEKKAVTSYLQRACVPAGFKLIAGNKSKRSARFTSHKFTCSQCRFKQKSRIPSPMRKKTRRHTRPDSALGDVNCPFRFSIIHDNEEHDWFFPPIIDGHKQHLGHHQLDPSHVPVPTACLTPEELDSVLNQLQLNFAPSKVQALLEMTTGIVLGRQQVKSLRQQMLKKQLVTSTSPAGRLLQRLQEDPSTSFVAHTAHIDNANRVTIRSHADVDLVSLLHPQSSAHQHSPTDDTNLSTKEKFALSVLKALRIPQSDSLLLCVAWATSSQKKWFRKFPSTLSLDVTCNTNSEKRPLARGTVKTGKSGRKLKDSLSFFCKIPSRLSGA